jgi:hypothetical protein
MVIGVLMQVLICGSRNWTNRARIQSVLVNLLIRTKEPHLTIITGGARGVDTIAHEEALRQGYLTKVFPAEWEKYGKSAGFKRNLQMLDQNPDRVIAFWDGKSKGTEHTITEANKRGIEVEIIYPLDKAKYNE